MSGRVWMDEIEHNVGRFSVVARIIAGARPASTPHADAFARLEVEQELLGRLLRMQATELPAYLLRRQHELAEQIHALVDQPRPC